MTSWKIMKKSWVKHLNRRAKRVLLRGFRGDAMLMELHRKRR